MSDFIEQDCTVEFQGRRFESGGAAIVDCTDGYRRGVVYADDGAHRCVTDWHGNKIADATYGPVFRGPFCRMQCVSFVYDGVRFTGRYCPDWATAIRVRSTRKVGGT